MKRLIATVSIVRIDEINAAIQPLRPSKFISINNSFLQVIDLTSATDVGVETTSVKNISHINYSIYPKYWDTLTSYRTWNKLLKILFNYLLMCLK